MLCEYCKIRKASQIHHIECSYHWNKKRNEEWHQLLAVCFHCHEEIHSHNNFDTREKCRKIALLNCKNKNDNTQMTSSK